MPDTSAQELFTGFYEAHKNGIFNYILYRTGFRREVAEDLTSEIFVKAFEHFDSFDRNRSFKTWIFTIAHNHLVNFYASRRDHASIDDIIGLGKDHHIPEDVDKNMTIARLMELVVELTPSQKELVIMRFVNDLSNSEIAGITGKEEGAIRTGISRALSTLREEYIKRYND